MKDRTTAYDIWRPENGTAPIVVDSPHSWRDPPEGFSPAAPLESLLTGWDAYVDELFSAAPLVGGTLLTARFPRYFLDANRARDDIDPDMLATPWPETLNPTNKSAAGMGLIRRLALPGVPVYRGLLSVEEVQSRIATYYDPYHHALSSLIEAAFQAHGTVLHLDCHSMKSVGNAMNEDAGQPRPDIVVSDRDGATASAETTALVARLFERRGYEVGINDPYKGADLISQYSAPDDGKHSIQIELKRGLYMDEEALTKLPGRFERLQQDITEVLTDLSKGICSA